MLSVCSTCPRSLSHKWIGNDLSAPHKILMKCALKTWIAFSAIFRLWLCGGTSWYFMLLSLICSLNSVEHSLSKRKCTANEFVQSLFSDSISIFLGMYFYIFPYTWVAPFFWHRLFCHKVCSGFALAAHATCLRLGLLPCSLRYALTARALPLRFALHAHNI